MIIDRPRDLDNDRKILSAPVIEAPLYQCAIAITVFAYRPNAMIELDVDGDVIAAPGGYPFPRGVTISLLDELVAGQQVRARQVHDGLSSDWTVAITVEDHTKEYPAGPPRPKINPAPVFQCGVRTGVSNLLSGGRVWITADGSTVGEVNGCAELQGVNVAPAYELGQRVRAWFDLCKDPSPPSKELVAGSPPNPLPAPTIDPLYESGRSVTVGNVVNGAVVTLYRDGANQGSWPCWGGSITINGLSPAFDTGNTFVAAQRMCPGDPESPPGSGTVQPCSQLPAPEIGPVQAGDDKVVVTQSQPDAIIKVWVNGVFAGTSGPPIVNLNVMLRTNDTVVVVQDLEGCQSQSAVSVTVNCVNPPVGNDPSALDLFPVGFSEFADGRISGSVYYPATEDGKDQPFNDRLNAVGRTPIVLMAHGNHSPADPSFLGYDYFQSDLAKMGFVAVSIDCNDLNGPTGGVQNIVDRADRIIATIAHFQSLDSSSSSVFFKTINFEKTGLMGHSRGGDAVVMVPSVIGLTGVKVGAVLALAPTNFNYRYGLPTIAPNQYPFMTVLPAGDGDVVDNNGAQFYDAAVSVPIKSQVYARYTNHNFFNRQWLADDSLWRQPQPAVSSRSEHERILTSYGCAFYRATLLSHGTESYLSGDQLPPTIMTENIDLSFERDGAVTIDNFDDANTINKNSFDEPNTLLSAISADEYRFDRPASGSTYNSSFYGLTVGMVAEASETNGRFRSQLRVATDLTNKEVWVRCAEVTDGATVAQSGTGFELGLEDENGIIAWLDSDQVGGVPRPYPRNPGMIKTMLSTLQFRAGCFSAPKFEVARVVAVLIRLNRPRRMPIAFDDLQIH